MHFCLVRIEAKRFEAGANRSSGPGLVVRRDILFPVRRSEAGVRQGELRVLGDRALKRVDRMIDVAGRVAPIEKQPPL